jgi:hypothetical protein
MHLIVFRARGLVAAEVVRDEDVARLIAPRHRYDYLRAARILGD